MCKVATEYRQKFKRDVVIDIFVLENLDIMKVMNRLFTQPIMYKKIREQESTLLKYSKTLINEGVLTEDDFLKEKKIIKVSWTKNLKLQKVIFLMSMIGLQEFGLNLLQNKVKIEEGITGIDIEKLKALKKSEFNSLILMHKTISRIFENRLKMIDTEQEY